MSQSPNTRRLVRWGLPLIAVALLVTGLAGPIERAWQAREARRAGTMQAQRIAEERAEIAADFNANRASILSELRQQIDAGQYSAAMTAAGRYVPVNDPELMQLYRKAAAIESARKRRTLYRDLVDRDCTETQARFQSFQILHSQRHEPPPRADALPPVSIGQLGRAHRIPDMPLSSVDRITRIAGMPARAAVIARMREPPPSERSLAANADWITQMRAIYRARPLQDFVSALADPGSDALICVWRVEGTWRAGSRDVRFALDLWLAPAPDGKKLEADPVGYSERLPSTFQGS
jgi:hypothetical protein